MRRWATEIMIISANHRVTSLAEVEIRNIMRHAAMLLLR